MDSITKLQHKIRNIVRKIEHHNLKGGIKNCCNTNKQTKQCKRSDGKIFKLPRKFSKHRCLQGVKGFTMRASCAPYKFCNKSRGKLHGGQQQQYDAIAVFQMGTISGNVTFKQNGDNVDVSYDITGLEDGDHGFHIHQYGDLSEECKSACAHFNPDNTLHGGLYTNQRHAGDLGNITSRGNRSQGTLTAINISTDQKHPRSIIGRSIIIHEDKDDLGRGGDIESTKTGNAGKRLGCAVIGLSKYSSC